MSFTETVPTSSHITSVLNHIAAAENTAVTDLPPLYDAVDPDALETLLQSEDVVVTFTYCGYQVTVTGYDTIFIVPEAKITRFPENINCSECENPVLGFTSSMRPVDGTECPYCGSTEFELPHP